MATVTPVGRWMRCGRQSPEPVRVVCWRGGSGGRTGMRPSRAERRCSTCRPWPVSTSMRRAARSRWGGRQPRRSPAGLVGGLLRSGTPVTRMVTVGGLSQRMRTARRPRRGHVRCACVIDDADRRRWCDPRPRPIRGNRRWDGAHRRDDRGDLRPHPDHVIPHQRGHDRTADLDDLMSRMIDRTRSTDTASRGSTASIHRSRGVLTWLPRPRGRRGEGARGFAGLPPEGAATAIFPSGLVNPLTMRAFNEARKSKQGNCSPSHHVLPSARRRPGVEPRLRLTWLPAVPVRGARRGGPSGSTTLERLRDIGARPPVTCSSGSALRTPPLSFPQPGWTLAIDRAPQGVPACLMAPTSWCLPRAAGWHLARARHGDDGCVLSPAVGAAACARRDDPDGSSPQTWQGHGPCDGCPR